MFRPTFVAIALVLSPCVVSSAADRSLEVLDQGRPEGRRSLRLVLAEGGRWRVLTTSKVTMTIGDGGAEAAGPSMPATEMESLVEVIDVDAAGMAKLAMTFQGLRAIVGPEAPVGTKQAIEHAARDLNRASGEFSMSDRGLVSGLRFGFEGDRKVSPIVKLMVDSMGPSLQQSLIPFPEEPVGVGGKWRMILPVTAAGMTQTVTTTYTLQELTAERVVLTTDIVQSAEPQDMQLPAVPGLPPGTTVRVESVAGAGGGRVEMNLDRPLPVTSTIRVKSNMTMRIGSAPGESQTIRQSAETDTQFVSEPAGAAAVFPAGAVR